MKVLMVAPSVRVPDTLGQTLHQLALANGLAKRGIQITLLCRYDSNQLNKEFDSNLKFLSINDPKIPFERLIFNLLTFTQRASSFNLIPLHLSQLVSL